MSRRRGVVIACVLIGLLVAAVWTVSTSGIRGPSVEKPSVSGPSEGGPSGEPPRSGTAADDESSPAPADSSALPQLTWAPPELDDPVTVTITEPGKVAMDDDTDYRLVAPGRIDGAVVLEGGRDVVWVGGHIRIGDQGPFPTTADRRGLVVVDGERASEERTVHLEGLRIDGPDLAEGINTNAPSATVQIQNVRIGHVHVRERDDLEGTGGYPSVNHPDVIQTWGSVGELRIDGLTAQSSYQGLFLKADRNRPHGPVWLRRVDVEAVSHTGMDGERFYGQRLLWWSAATSGPLFVDEGTVWLDHHPRSEWGPGIGDNVHPPDGASDEQAAVVARVNGQIVVTWPASASVTSSDGPAVRNWSDTRAGVVYSGEPPPGDYVPAAQVGTDYSSPGYVEDPPTAGSAS